MSESSQQPESRADGQPAPDVMSGWKTLANPLIEARPGATLKEVFRQLHEQAESQAAQLPGGPCRVLAMFSGNLHLDDQGPGPKVGPEVATIDVIVTERDVLFSGIDASGDTIMQQVGLSSVTTVEGSMSRGALFRKFFAIRLHVAHPDGSVEWRVVSPLDKESGPRWLDALRSALGGISS